MVNWVDMSWITKKVLWEEELNYWGLCQK